MAEQAGEGDRERGMFQVILTAINLALVHPDPVDGF